VGDDSRTGSVSFFLKSLKRGNEGRVCQEADAGFG